MLLASEPDDRTRRRLQAELEDVGRRFARELESDLACVNALVKHVERYRGKMLRPLLVLVSAAAARGEAAEWEIPEAHRVLATVVEMVHMATLVHDDVLDGAATRRKGRTVNALHGNETAVMLGDYLISHAYHLCAGIEDQAVSRDVAATTNTVCEGELLQLSNRENWELAESVYFEIVDRKTASLCGLCCRLGGRLAGADPARAAHLETYGRKLGIAFQIVDDVLDLSGNERTVGKTLGLDVGKGKMTLPLIRARDTATAAQRAELERLTRDAGEHSRARVKAIVDETGGFVYAMELAAGLVEEAKATITTLPESGALTLLEEMAAAVLTREF